MALKRLISNIDVVQAAEKRIKNVFDNGLPVYLCFSGGKDSLVLAQLIVTLIQKGEISASQLTVQFIDEEAIFPCIEKKTKEWRKKFLLLGAKFEWFCLEVKHFNCFNELSNDETFICWDSTKENVWVRKPPPFAIRTHKRLKPRKDSYQDFLPKATVNGITLTGVRTAESVQRLLYFSNMFKAGTNMTKRNQIFPIYDWSDRDVWYYILEQHIDIPDIYLYLWQTGTSRRQLRVSQFFSVDTARSLVKMNEYYPNLMERIIKREPNAYLAALYWDSEMFGRSSKGRKEIEKDTQEKDYKAKLTKIFNDFDTHFITKHQKYIAKNYRNFFIKVSSIADNKDYKRIYEGLISGDPKLRTHRALYQHIFGKYITQAKREEAERHG